MKTKPIKGFGGYYRVGDDGSVWSCKIKGARYGERGPWRRLQLTNSGNQTGHLTVNLRMHGKYHRRYVHRLVLEAFVGLCPPGMKCRHYPDQDPTNNNLSNLAWASNSRNQLDRRENGNSNQGERCGTSKLTTKKVRIIRRLYATGDFSQLGLSKIYQVTRGTIAEIVRGKSWTNV